MSFGETFRQDGISRSVERHTNVRTRHLKINGLIASHTVAPIDDAIMASVDRGFHNRTRNLLAQRIDEVAGAAPGIAGRQNTFAVLGEDTQAHGFSSMEDGLVRHRAPEGRGQGGNRRDIAWPLSGDGARYDSAKTVADQMDLAPGFRSRSRDRVVKMALDEQIWTVCIETDS